VTSRVNPRNTSHDCARCSAPVARYDTGQPAERYTPGAPLVFCPDCQMRGNADRNASIVIGKRLLTRYQKRLSQEKPPTPLATERSSKEEGVASSQDARSATEGHLTTLQGTERVTRMAPRRSKPSRMVLAETSISHQLRWFNE